MAVQFGDEVRTAGSASSSSGEASIITTREMSLSQPIFLKMSRKLLEISKNFLEISRNFLEISKKFQEILRNS